VLEKFLNHLKTIYLVKFGTYKNFIERRNKALKTRLGENIKRSRAAVSRTVINEYFDNLEISLSGIPPQNIINYD